MSDFYGSLQGTASELLGEFKTGTVLLERTSFTEDYTPGGPFPPTPEQTITTVYRLDATVRGVAAKYVDGTLVQASDLQAVCAVTAEIVSVNGEPASGTEDIVPTLEDVLMIDGAARTILRVLPTPAAGQAVAVTVFIRG